MLSINRINSWAYSNWRNIWGVRIPVAGEMVMRVIRLAAGHRRLSNWPMYWGMEIIVDKMPPLVSTWNSIVVIKIHFIFKVGILIIFIVLIIITTLLVMVIFMIQIFSPAPRPTQSYQLQCQAGCLRSDRPKIRRRLRILKKTRT